MGLIFVVVAKVSIYLLRLTSGLLLKDNEGTK